MTTVPEPRPPSSRIATIPNILSFARLATVPIFLWLWFADERGIAVAIYAAGATTDFFDGFIARRLDQVSDLGKLLDPLADRIFIVALAVSLVGSGALPWPLALAIVLRDVLILSLYPMVQRRRLHKIEVNFTGKSATAALLIGLTWLAVSEAGVRVAIPEVGVGIIALGAVLYWVAGALYLKQAMQPPAKLG